MQIASRIQVIESFNLLYSTKWVMLRQQQNIYVYWFTCHKKVICCFKLNMYLFFYPISSIFSCFLIFDCIIISTVKFAHTLYIFNKNIHKTKWFTILEDQFIGNLELFWIKKFLVSALNTMGGIRWGDIMNERSKLWKSIFRQKPY